MSRGGFDFSNVSRNGFVNLNERPCVASFVQDVGELSLCRIVLDLGVAGDGVTTSGSGDAANDGVQEVDMRSQVTFF